LPFKIVRNDITKMQVDAIVNAANTSLKMGAGVCGAIFSAAGKDELQKECDVIGGCDVGQAVITKGYKLPAKHVIHTVGPIWKDGKSNEQQLLANCYTNSLNLAMEKECTSIAFPLIASGVYGYPKEDALTVAINSIRDFLEENDIMIYLVVFDKKAFALSQKRYDDIEKFIDDNYVDDSVFERRADNRGFNDVYNVDGFIGLRQPMARKERSLNDIIENLDESFSQMLLRLIDDKGMTDVQTYKRANIDRKLFSKIRGNKDYNPSKQTVIAFSIALMLNKDETLDLLTKAGFTLSHSNKFDVIIEFFIEQENYDIFEINEALFAFDQLLLSV
jgi:O-acetyl-ADP-ribose deacetylase